MAMASATGVASHIPVIPNKAGSAMIAMAMHKNERENASSAEIRPFDRAVNIPLAKTLKPINNNANVHILFPVTARPYTGLSGFVKTETKGSVIKNDIKTVKNEMAEIIFRLRFMSFLSLNSFISPW